MEKYLEIFKSQLKGDFTINELTFDELSITYEDYIFNVQEDGFTALYSDNGDYFFNSCDEAINYIA